MHERCKWLRASTLAIGMALVPQSLVKAREPLLDLVQERHRISVQSIHTVHCELTETDNINNRKQVVGKSEYWRSNGGFAIRSTYPGSKISVWYSDFKTTTFIEQVGPSGRNRKYATVVARSDRIDDTILGKAGLLFSGPNWEQLTFDELLEKPHKIRAVKKVIQEDKELVFVDLANETARLELWFDPAVNYLVRKRISYALPPPGSTAKEQKGAESTVSRFREVVPTIFFPQQIDARGSTPDGRIWTSTDVFSNIQINHPVPPEILQVRFPSGIEVTDNVQNKVFKVESDGSLKVIADRTPSQIAPVASGGQKLFQTKHEPRPWHWWLLPASLGILALAGVGWIIRRRRGEIP